MQTITKTLLNNFLIGILAVIPIVVVLQIIFFIKDMLMGIFGIVHGYANSYFYTSVVFVLSFFILVFIGHEIVKKSRPILITLFEKVIDRIPLLNTVYRVMKKVIATTQTSAT